MSWEYETLKKTANCKGCQRLKHLIETTTSHSPEKWMFRLHPKMFDWAKIGENRWVLVQVAKARSYFLLHNEKFHVTLPRSSLLKLVLQTDCTTEKFGAWSVLQNDHGRKFISSIRNSLQRLEPDAQGMLTDPSVSAVRILDGLLLPSALVQTVHAVKTKKDVESFFKPLFLYNSAMNKKWHGFLFQEARGITPQLYEFNYKTSLVQVQTIPSLVQVVFPMTDANSWQDEVRGDHHVLKEEELFYRFDAAKDEILVDEKKELFNSDVVYQAILKLQKEPYSAQDFVLMENHDHSSIYAVYLRGPQPRSLRILPSPTKQNTSYVLSVRKRDTSILQLSSMRIHSMLPEERSSFLSLVCEQVKCKTLFAPTGGISSLSLKQDDPQSITWMRFLATSVPFAQVQKMQNLKIRLLHVESAWHRFQGQMLDMLNRGLPSSPELMFHGVRAENSKDVTHDIVLSGFNAKHAKVSMYGGGGIYCSPDAECALSYVKYPMSVVDPRQSNMNKENHMFICLTLPGKVGSNGKQDQQMAPDQNSWFTLLPPYHRVYCIEPNAVLPIAEVVFSWR